jgi:hypothetical protein
MRGFLERKPELIPAGVDITGAEEGYQAVEILARAVGLADSEISAARLASRADLASSAWAVDAGDGLDELLTELAGRAAVLVRVEPGDPAGPAVLEALGLPGDPRLIESDPQPTDPQRLLVIGTSWRGALDAAAAAGCPTALIDRYNRRAGRPTWRAADLADLLNPIRTWLNESPEDST